MLRFLGAVALVCVTSCSRTCARGERPAPAALSGDAATAEAAPLATVTDARTDACVDVDADVRARYDAWKGTSGGNPPDDFDAAVQSGTFAFRSEVPDLDGDGVKEISWMFANPSTNEVQYLYRGGACGVYLGELPPAALKVESTKHEGHADVFTEDATACEGAFACHCKPEVRHYQLTQGVYRENASRRVPGVAEPCAPGATAAPP